MPDNMTATERWRQQNKEHIRRWRKAYNQKHSEHNKAYCKEYYWNHRKPGTRFRDPPITWEEVGSCWICSSHLRAVYPSTRINRKLVSLSRLIWSLDHRRRVPEKMVIMHTCDNPRCIKPTHLLLGTFSDNSRDMVKKSRNGGPWGHAKERK